MFCSFLTILACFFILSYVMSNLVCVMIFTVFILLVLTTYAKNFIKVIQLLRSLLQFYTKIFFILVFYENILVLC